MLEYDNRHLWMKLKRIVSSHFANYQEAWNMNRLISRGAIQHVMSAAYDLEEVGDAALPDHQNTDEGQLAVRCLATSAGLGLTDPEKPDATGEDKTHLFQ